MLSYSRIAAFRCSASVKWVGPCASVASSPSSKSNSRVVAFSPTMMPIRLLSTKDLFGSMDSSVAEKLVNIPVLQPPKPRLSVEEMVASGQSVLNELDLWTWYKPTSYFRWALESIHMHLDIPWWGTIIVATCALRLAFIFVPIMSQKMVGKQNQHRRELDGFKDRIQEAKAEGNNLLIQQIFMEQREFMLSKGIKMGRQLAVTLINGSVFISQFFAIKKMVAVGYPGLSTGGIGWFTDLTAADPYYILPSASALTLFLVAKIGIEFGASANQMAPLVRIGLQYVLPAIVLAFGSQFSSGVTLYWVTSNSISLVYSGFFHIPLVRKALGIPLLTTYPVEANKKNSLSEFLDSRKISKNAPPTLEDIKKKDVENFKKAGRGQPAVKVDSG